MISKDLLERIADSTHVMMACLDADFNFLWVNRAYAEAGGREPEEYIGKNHFELYPHEENEAIFRRVVETGEPFSIRAKPFEHPDQPERGTTYWDWRLVPLKDDSGTVRRMLFTLTDVTDAERAEQKLRDSESQLSAIIENAPFVMFVVDEERRVQKINATGAEFAGRPPEEIPGVRAGEALRCLHALDDPRGCGYGEACRGCTVRNTVLDAIETGKTHRQVEADMAFTRGDGNVEKTFLLYATPLRISGEHRVLVVLEDITDLKQAEHELRTLNAELEERVAERTAEARERTEQLQRLALELTEAEDRERRRLAGVLHDDLQQTLAYAKLRAGMLKRAEGDSALAETADELREAIAQAIQTSRNLSRDLNPPLLHVEGLGPALAHLATAMSQRYGLSVETDIQETSPDLPERRRTFAYRAARELLFNAVKHAEADRAHLRFRRNGDLLEVIVEDNGVGFEPEKVRQRPGRNQGVGLFSIQERADLLGGRLAVESTPGSGSRFVLSLPTRDGSAEWA